MNSLLINTDTLCFFIIALGQRNLKYKRLNMSSVNLIVNKKLCSSERVKV